MTIKKSILLRVRIGVIVITLFALIITAKVSYIQWGERNKWLKLASKTRFGYLTVKATRGNILSDNGSLLVTSLPFYKVAFDPTLATDKLFKENITSLSSLLSHYFKDKSGAAYKQQIQDARLSGKRYIVLNRKKINYQDKKIMSSWPIFKQGRYRGGVLFEKTNVRYYPFSKLCQRTLGFINKAGVGVGLEYKFNPVLKGKEGKALFQKISGSTWKPVFDGNYTKAIDGLDIETTIDINLQDVAETSLQRAMHTHKADAGTVIVMEVKTGHIKAICNLSATNKNRYIENFNYAIGASFEPGSVFKLVTLLALLEDTPLLLTDSIDTHDGEYIFYDHKVRDHKQGGYGKITVQTAFEVSSNIAMAKLADQYFGSNPSRFLHYIDRLHLSTPLEIEIPGQFHPKVTHPTDSIWSGITLPWMSYGYGIEMSPLHILTLYNAVANDGALVKPMFVKSIKNAHKTVSRFKTQTLNSKICTQKTLIELKILLEGVVKQGTASNLNNTHYAIAGKTGTSQILTRGQYEKKYATSFVGYFPANNPKYTIMVLIKNPKGIFQYGNSVAGPVFREIADNIYARDINIHLAMAEQPPQLGVFPIIRSGRHKDLIKIANTLGISNHSDTDEEWVTTQRKGNAVIWKKNLILSNRVPNVLGMTFRDAIYVLEKSGLRVSYQGNGRVESQSITAGSRVKKGKIIFIQLG